MEVIPDGKCDGGFVKRRAHRDALGRAMRWRRGRGRGETSVGLPLEETEISPSPAGLRAVFVLEWEVRPRWPATQPWRQIPRLSKM